MILNRKDVRKYFAGLLKLQLPGVYNVFPYRKIVLSGLSPVVLVSSGSTIRKPVRNKVTSAKVTLMVFAAVLHTVAVEGWTEEMAEDQLDDIEAGVARTCEQNPTSPYWESIYYERETMIERFEVSGGPYLVEVFAISMEVK